MCRIIKIWTSCTVRIWDNCVRKLFCAQDNSDFLSSVKNAATSICPPQKRRLSDEKYDANIVTQIINAKNNKGTMFLVIRKRLCRCRHTHIWPKFHIFNMNYVNFVQQQLSTQTISSNHNAIIMYRNYRQNSCLWQTFHPLLCVESFLKSNFCW